MRVTFFPLDSLYHPISTACSHLANLFKRFVITLFSACWGKRVAKPIQMPSKTDESAQKVFQKIVKGKKAPTESRFPRAMWDLANGLSQKDLTFIEDSEKTLNEEEKIELRSHCQNILDPSRKLQYQNDKALFLSFLRKLDNFNAYLEYIKSILLKIQSGSSSREELKMEVRQIRQYFINRYTWFAEITGQTNGGQVEPFVDEFFKPLFGYSLTSGEEYVIGDGRLINNEYINHGKTKTQGWVAGFTFQEGGHAVAYVYTKEGFVKFDNLHQENAIYSTEEIHKLLSKNPQDVLRLIRFPLDKYLDRIPDVKSWITPTWERNNCFASASLIFLALGDYYNER